MLQLLVGYIHLLATCLALGSVLVADWRLFRGRRYAMRQGALARLMATSNMVLFSLVLLWITGPMLLWLAYSADPAHFTMNGKLWAKITVVTVLTINGWLLHVIAFPRLGRGTVLLDKPFSERCAFAVLGAISCVSWLFAAFLGIARSWNTETSYQSVMWIYSVLLLTAALSGVVLFAERAGSEKSATSPSLRT